MTITVLVVDDHPVVRAGLVALLSVQPTLRIVGAAANGAEAIRAATELRPDVILSDLRLGDGPDGVDVTRVVRSGTPPVPAVLILTTYDHDHDLVRAVEAGAAGYLLKDAAADDIVAAIEAAAHGESLLGAELTARVVHTMRVRNAALSARELEVLRLVAAGMPNREIARALVVSQATVKTHLNHAFTKLKAHSRTEAVATARAAGLID